jgi:hypothetical protein
MSYMFEDSFRAGPGWFYYEEIPSILGRLTEHFCLLRVHMSDYYLIKMETADNLRTLD